jgi:arginyl-tRNA synthetase
MKSRKKDLADIISKATSLSAQEAFRLIEVPPQPEFGDLAFPCFALARLEKKNPSEIASRLAAEVSLEGTAFRELEASGPYLNFFLEESALTKEILLAIHTEKDKYGTSPAGAGQTVVIDYSSPNIAKPFHIGHLRSTVIGAALTRIYQALGYETVGINHLGDWGTQFGMVMAAYKENPDEDMLRQDPVRYLLKLYTGYQARAENEESAQDAARTWFKRLENGDPEAVRLWERFKGLSLEEFQRVYERLDIHFDYYTGESFYNDKMDSVIEKIIGAGLLSRGEDGAEMVRLDDYGMPPCLLRKSDGATLYATRDLAAAIYRAETFMPARILYVVGTPQELHFRQLFKVLELMGYEWADRLFHVKFGHVQGMKTRRGEVVFLEDVVEEAKARAREKINENIQAGKLEQDQDMEELAENIGTGAIIANDLKNRRERDVIFDWDKVLNFDGETGPYLQYTHARICGILRKANKPVNDDANLLLLSEAEESTLVKHLSRYPDVVDQAGAENEPSIITTYLFDLTKAFNIFYIKHRVVGSGEGLERARLYMVDAVRQVLKNGLGILGIKALERM